MIRIRGGFTLCSIGVRGEGLPITSTARMPEMALRDTTARSGVSGATTAEKKQARKEAEHVDMVTSFTDLHSKAPLELRSTSSLYRDEVDPRLGLIIPNTVEILSFYGLTSLPERPRIAGPRMCLPAVLSLLMIGSGRRSRSQTHFRTDRCLD